MEEVSSQDSPGIAVDGEHVRSPWLPATSAGSDLHVSAPAFPDATYAVVGFLVPAARGLILFLEIQVAAHSPLGWKDLSGAATSPAGLGF